MAEKKPDYAGGRKAREELRSKHEKEMEEMHTTHLTQRQEMGKRHEGEIGALFEKHYGGGKKEGKAPIYKSGVRE